MNKLLINLVLALLGCSVILSSCKRVESSNIGDCKFDSLCVHEKTAHLFNDTAKPACKLTLRFTYIKDTNDSLLKAGINKMLRAEFFGDKSAYISNEKAFDNYITQYTSQYRKDLEPMFLKEQKELNSIDNWYSYYKEQTGDVLLYSDDYLVYQIDYNEYTGGAHGMYGTYFLNIDLKNLKRITLDELFTKDYMDILTDLIWSQLMADNNVDSREELEEMGYCTTGDVSEIKNFYLNKDGLTILYNPYEITPYSMGQVKVTIPYQMLEHILDTSLPVIQNLRD